jgi:hypothetical protein
MKPLKNQEANATISMLWDACEFTITWSENDMQLAIIYHKHGAPGGIVGNDEAQAALDFALEGYRGKNPGLFPTHG